MQSDKSKTVALAVQIQRFFPLPRRWVKATNTPAIQQISAQLLLMVRHVRNEIKIQQPEEALLIKDRDAAWADCELMRNGN